MAAPDHPAPEPTHGCDNAPAITCADATTPPLAESSHVIAAAPPSGLDVLFQECAERGAARVHAAWRGQHALRRACTGGASGGDGAASSANALRTARLAAAAGLATRTVQGTATDVLRAVSLAAARVHAAAHGEGDATTTDERFIAVVDAVRGAFPVGLEPAAAALLVPCAERALDFVRNGKPLWRYASTAASERKHRKRRAKVRARAVGTRAQCDDVHTPGSWAWQLAARLLAIVDRVLTGGIVSTIVELVSIAVVHAQSFLEATGPEKLDAVHAAVLHVTGAAGVDEAWTEAAQEIAGVYTPLLAEIFVAAGRAGAGAVARACGCTGGGGNDTDSASNTPDATVV